MSKTERPERCDRCKWWEPEPGKREDPDAPMEGRCCRFPPMALKHDGDSSNFMHWNYPATVEDDFCGEFTPKQAEQPTVDDGVFFEQLPNRVISALYSAGIETVEQLLQTSKYDLECVRNLGAISLTEIRTLLRCHGLHLKGEK